MEVIRPGTKVLLGGVVAAVVLAVCVRVGITYEVAWYDGPRRTTAWVEPHEVTPDDQVEPLRIGFKG